MFTVKLVQKGGGGYSVQGGPKKIARLALFTILYAPAWDEGIPLGKNFWVFVLSRCILGALISHN